MASPHGRDTTAHDTAKQSHGDGERCAWYSSGKQCFLPASMSPDIGDRRRQYCHWHFLALTRPEFAKEYDEFDRWMARWRNYCSLENHYPIAVVWQAIVGLSPLSGEPTSCGNLTCRYAITVPRAKQLAIRREQAA